ncbi:NYN domain-containing protein [Candidatus Poriferisocius sp.]|uniref:NYN domain-containing protein n=1 Tax=Candidatus Poriferisocius sp. TaxID=3101276 RepID=UPI003B0191B6
MEKPYSPAIDELRQVLVAAVEAAKAGLKEKPPIDPPTRLKPLLRLTTKLPDRALSQVRGVVDSDEEFRGRVVESVKEEDLGRVGWLWLTRPDGWEQECRDLAEAAEIETEQATGNQQVEALEQKLQRTEAALEKAERRREKAEEDRDAARNDAMQARTQARRSADEAAKLSAELDKVRAGKDGALKKLERAQRKQDRTESKLKSVTAKKDRLEKEWGEARDQHRDELDDLTERLAVAQDGVDRARAAGFDPDPEPPPVVEADPDPEPPLTHRVPASLPPGMLQDTVEAAEHLLRHEPDLVVLVDGYNVTFKNWADLPPRGQRQRFLQKLEELSARYSGVDLVVVFDGKQTDYDYIPTTARSLGLSVRFSAPGVTADDHIIGLCDNYPLKRKIVVVSEDNEVRERARDRGANLVRPYKLLEIMGLEVADPLGWSGFGE